MDVTPRSSKPQRDWLSTGEAAEELAVSGKTVLRWIHQGLLPARRIRAGGQYRLERSAIERFKAEQQQEERPQIPKEGPTERRPDLV